MIDDCINKMEVQNLNAEQIIEQSIIKVQESGIRIARGPLFSWSKNKTMPDSCDCFGAVLIVYSNPFRDFPKGWLKYLCKDILNKDLFWFRRFDYGFNQLNTTYKYSEKSSDLEFDDDVSKFAMRLSKKYVR